MRKGCQPPLAQARSPSLPDLHGTTWKLEFGMTLPGLLSKTAERVSSPERDSPLVLEGRTGGQAAPGLVRLSLRASAGGAGPTLRQVAPLGSAGLGARRPPQGLGLAGHAGQSLFLTRLTLRKPTSPYNTNVRTTTYATHTTMHTRQNSPRPSRPPEPSPPLQLFTNQTPLRAPSLRSSDRARNPIGASTGGKRECWMYWEGNAAKIGRGWPGQSKASAGGGSAARLGGAGLGWATAREGESTRLKSHRSIKGCRADSVLDHLVVHHHTA